jgi:uncharacterized protein YndB with AHSA1/START domain
VRAFDAPRAMVYEAFTRPDLVRRWLTGPEGWTMPVCEIDLRVGGTFRCVWSRDGKQFGLRGQFCELVPPARIVHTEIFDDDWTGGEALVTTVFEAGDVTTVTMTIRYASQAVRDAVVKTGMTSGVEASYDRLERILSASGGAVVIGGPEIVNRPLLG